MHIKSLGLHTKIVQIKLTYTVNGKEETLCQGYNIPIKENKKTVIVYATEVLDYIQRIHSQECTSMITAKVTFENTSTKTTSITLKCEENAPKPQKSVYTTDRVLVEVAEENSDESETTAKNLLVGCIGRLEGTGKANDSNTLSLYTMQFYNLFVFDFIHLGKIMEDQIKDFKNNIEDRKKIVSILKNLVTEKNGNLKYKELRTLLEEAQKRRRPFWERQVCRDAWYEIDYRIDSNRYGSNQECPPGPVYIIPIYEENINYTIFASQNGSSAIISHSVNRNGNVENNKFASRAGIAFHTGNSTWSQGCITLNNTDQKNRPHEIDLFNRLFSGKHGLHQKGYIGNMKDKNRTKLMSKTTKDEAKNDAATRLRMLMIEERGVEGEIAVQCVKDLPIKDYNHDPKNDCRYYHHVKPKPIPQLALRKVELKITYTEKTIKEEREVLETKTRTILTPEITQTQNRDGGKINILAAQAGDTISALVQTSYEEDLSDIQTKDIKWKLTKGKTSETTIGSDYSYTIPETTAENTIIKLEVKVKVQSNCFIFKITVENNKKDVLKSQLK